MLSLYVKQIDRLGALVHGHMRAGLRTLKVTNLSRFCLALRTKMVNALSEDDEATRTLCAAVLSLMKFFVVLFFNF